MSLFELSGYGFYLDIYYLQRRHKDPFKSPKVVQIKIDAVSDKQVSVTYTGLSFKLRVKYRKRRPYVFPIFNWLERNSFFYTYKLITI